METPSYPELESNVIPCPQCGSTKLHFMYYNPPGVARISCEDCGRTKYGEPTYKQGLRNFDTKRMQSAINKWNTRDGLYDPIPQQIEEYKALRLELIALPEADYQARKLELVLKHEELENLIHSQLLPCPRCGSNEIKISDIGADLVPVNTTNVVTCIECGLALPVHGKSEVLIERMFASMNKWNKRPK